MMKCVSLKEFGGKAAESITNTDFFDNSFAFSKALQALQNSGGGMLSVSKGVWHTGPIELFSNITLNLEEGSVISFIPEPERYGPVFTRWEGADCYAMHPCVFINNQTNVKISGSGIIDGNGEPWWAMRRAKSRQKEPQSKIELQFAKLNPEYKTQPSGGGGRYIQFLRPPLVQFYKCSNCTLEGVTIQNSPFWTVHPLYSDSIIISNISVKNPASAPNTDGIDVDSCTNVTVSGCKISVGDDGIAIKSGADDSGIKAAKPCEHITVSGCTVSSGHGGIVIGSETAAGIYDITAKDCLFDGTDRGIRIKTRRRRGGAISGLHFINLTMKNNLCPLAVNMYYVCGANPEDPYLFSLDKQPFELSTPSIKDVEFIGIKAAGCKASAGFMAGLPESPISNVKIQGCLFETNEGSSESPQKSEMFAGIPPVSEKSFRLINVEHLSITDSVVRGPAEDFIYQ